jgi:hypothetical protein
MYKRQWTCYRDMIADHGAEEKGEERKVFRISQRKGNKQRQLVSPTASSPAGSRCCKIIIIIGNRQHGSTWVEEVATWIGRGTNSFF